MKKSLILILLVSLYLLSACENEKMQPLEEFYKDAKIESVDKVIIQDGSTGASKTIIQQERIGEFLALIKDIKFTPQENQEKREGWRYGIALFDGEKEFKFTLNEIDTTYYDSNPDIHPIVDNYYNQLDVVEE
jgi:hypothetical protein